MKNLIKNKSILIICICVFIFTGTAQGQENGGFFEIDCFHVDPALSSEGTKDKITVKFWSNSTLLGEQSGSFGAPLGIGGLNLITLVINGIRLLGNKEGCDCSIFHIACYPSPKNNLQNLTHISVETNGTDALFIDEAAFKAYQTVTGSGLAVNTPIPGKTIKWGKESGNGWCLSKESNDVNEFSNYVIDGSCHQAITFHKDGRVTQGIYGKAGSIKGGNASKIWFSNGTYVQQYGSGAKNWVETDKNGTTKFNYQEIGRDEFSVYLYDGARKVKIALDLWTKKIKYSDAKATTYRNLYSITDAK